MDVYVFWFIVVFITIVTRIAITFTIADCEISWKNKQQYYKTSKRIRIVLHILSIICVAFVVGIIGGKLYSTFDDNFMIYFIICTYVVYYLILGLYHYKTFLSQICFVIACIISVICCTKIIKEYDSNIEIVENTIIVNMIHRPLLYFDEIPVQNVSGQIGGNHYIIRGEISTTNQIPYWYIDANGKGIYDSAPADISKIDFIEDGETAYLRIITYCTQRTTINHNNGEEDIYKEKTWKEYVFYLPEEAMQYNIN